VATNSCSSETAIFELAAGVLTGPEADALLAHAAECSECAARLKAVLGVFAEEEVQEPDAPISFDNVRRLAARMAVPPVSEMPVRPARRNWLPAVAAVAAMVVVTFGALTYLRKQSQQPPFDLLARAYTKRRPFELRIDGAAYGPVRQERGAGGSDALPELLEARAAIQQRLDSHPADADFLRAKGQAELLAWEPDAAITSFQKASDLGLDDPAFLVDFATAYFERAEGNRAPKDYTSAEQKLTAAIVKRPGFAVALFNRAIVYTRLNRANLAKTDFEAVLKTETNSEWAQDAARRLAQLR
jgi:tetratricopeptide (TPR) repeat protein